jgi:aspartate carbamoyltransferase catalytic subunit
MITTHRFRLVAHTMVFMSMAAHAAEQAAFRRITVARDADVWYTANLQAERAQQIATVAAQTYQQRRGDLLGHLPDHIRSN